MSGRKPGADRKIERDRQIRAEVFVGTDSIAEIAKRYGVTKQRVDQIAYPDKAEARQLVSYAIKTGRLVRRRTCERCLGSGRIEAHHPDYSKPLDVEWLCRGCHAGIGAVPPRRSRQQTERADVLWARRYLAGVGEKYVWDEDRVAEAKKVLDKATTGGVVSHLTDT